MLPSYAAVRVLATEPTDEACRGKALELARTVRSCLRAIPPRDESVLRMTYTPRRWPASVEKAFASLAPIAVRLALADDPWPARSARSGLEDAVATRLAASLVSKARVPVAKWTAQAQSLLGSAVVAYATARSLEAPALSLS